MSKKVGTACMTKNQIRRNKNKGKAFERDVEASLQELYPDCYMTHEKGYITQYDLKSDNAKIVVECKRHFSLSWNELNKVYDKLYMMKPDKYKALVIFKSNQQPSLVYDGTMITSFANYFCTPFIKHSPVKKKEMKNA